MATTRSKSRGRQGNDSHRSAKGHRASSRGSKGHSMNHGKSTSSRSSSDNY